MRKFLIAALVLVAAERGLKPATTFWEMPGQNVVAGFSSRPVLQTVPVVRIGLNQNASTTTLRSSAAFTVQQTRTRPAKFTPALGIDPTATGRTVDKADLQYRMVVELDSGKLVILPIKMKVRIEPTGTPIEIENRSYRGVIEVFGNSRNTLTLVNELPMEEYLLGVVPNELSPSTFGELEALKAQAVAARTYIARNMGQSKNEGYDICATDACQVYMGEGSEQPLSTQAVMETRGVIATYKDEPINALYSSTCGGRTEDAENIFDEKFPYLVSTMCEYKHPAPLPFSTSKSFQTGKTPSLLLLVCPISPRRSSSQDCRSAVSPRRLMQRLSQLSF